MEFTRVEKKSFDVGTICVHDLFHNGYVNLSIPEYQRPYVWNEEHITEMLNDWKDHFFKDNQLIDDKIEYYLGTIMIHDNHGQLEIIDGQQRLTTLLIMDNVWNSKNTILNNGKLNFNYKSQTSFRKIKENQHYLSSYQDTKIALSFNKIIKKLILSVVITNSEDRAFVFFDSQNNRGVPLDEIDFFKSYHLRELNNHEQYLRYFAKRFDQINALNNTRSNKHLHLKSLNEIFIKQLWRIRFWSKNKLWFPNRRLLLDTFQKNTISFDKDKVNEIKLYPSFNNNLGTSLVFNKEMKPELKSIIKLYGSESIDIPFTINQPIQRGIGFFLYAEKYTSLFNYLFRDEKVTEIKDITNLVYQVYNEYFINLYQVSLMLYYDKFGKEKIEKFAKLFEHYLGAFRMNRSSIVEQSPIVLLRDYGNVLMDIQQAYLPSEVLDALKKYTPEQYYANFNYKNNNTNLIDSNLSITIQDSSNKPLSKARQDYYQKVKELYSAFIKDNYQLKEKHNWINASIN